MALHSQLFRRDSLEELYRFQAKAIVKRYKPYTFLYGSKSNKSSIISEGMKMIVEMQNAWNYERERDLATWGNEWMRWACDWSPTPTISVVD